MNVIRAHAIKKPNGVSIPLGLINACVNLIMLEQRKETV